MGSIRSASQATQGDKTRPIEVAGTIEGERTCGGLDAVAEQLSRALVGAGGLLVGAGGRGRALVEEAAPCAAKQWPDQPAKVRSEFACVEQRMGWQAVWACGPLGWEFVWGVCPKACLAWAPLAASDGAEYPQLSSPHSPRSPPAARLVLSPSSTPTQPAPFVSRQLTGLTPDQQSTPLCPTEPIAREHCRRRKPASVPPSEYTRCPRLEDQPVRPSLSFAPIRSLPSLRSISATLANVASSFPVRTSPAATTNHAPSRSAGNLLPASTPNGVPDSTFAVAVSIGFVLASF
ncbi:hypothetical protein AOQ84DRAFT_229559 [Glonium stellatum]|uniref:Uncharacterized protein n=1 Tax=Glonium stellatum TaxID=574774 RepID=A0A8E2ENU5_9PEZI|nr:hypothetical protein AOQ84DRAFT_229559 [Glonium stellatum]